jgi:hypothetical protein
VLAFAWLASTHGRTQPVHTCTPGALKSYYCTLHAVATKNSMLTQMENKHTIRTHTVYVDIENWMILQHQLFQSKLAHFIMSHIFGYQLYQNPVHDGMLFVDTK